MNINKKFKCFGYLDLCTSTVQIEVATATTVASMYYQLHKEKDEITLFSTYIWPIVNLIVTVIVVMINVGQVQVARRLIRTGRQEVSTAEMDGMIKTWNTRNIVTFGAQIVWFTLFGIITFWIQGWSLLVIGGLFLGTTVSRGMVTWGINGLKFVEELDMPDFPADLMEEMMEMQRQRRHRQETPIREPGWI